MKPCIIVGTILTTVTLVRANALADDDRAVCFDSVEKGQSLRKAHKLVEARDQFRLCAAATCPATMQGDCSNWLNEIEKSIPTVVLSAKDALGNDVFEVSVSMDDKPLVGKLEGTAIAVDPGAHNFRFQWADGTSRERQVLVSEGQKDVVVAVSLAPPGGVPITTPPAQSVTPSVSPSSPGGTPWPTIGWIVGGVGVVGLALGGIFAGITISDKNAADCNSATRLCSNYASMNSAMSAAPVSGVGFIGGGALVVTGAALLLFTHATKEARPTVPTARFRVEPMAGPGVGGALFEGLW